MHTVMVLFTVYLIPSRYISEWNKQRRNLVQGNIDIMGDLMHILLKKRVDSRFVGLNIHDELFDKASMMGMAMIVELEKVGYPICD